MAILRSEIRNKYTSIPNTIIQCKDLSDGDFRLLIYLYSLPDKWKINQGYLGQEMGCSRININKKIKRIKEAGYLEIVKGAKETDTDFIYVLKEKGVSLGDVSLGDVSLGDVSLGDTHINTYIINNNNIKTNNKKENIKRKYFDDEELNTLFLEFLDFRKKLKAVNSDRAINNLLKTLESFPDDIKKQMINQSITNSWKGVFSLKQQKERKSIFEL